MNVKTTSRPMESQSAEGTIASLRVPWRFLFLAGLVLLAFSPAFDNGFISDDYIFLDRVHTWREDPGYLFSIPPENFRMTTYLAFGILKTLFGYHAAWFYAFTMLVHFINAILVWKLLSMLNRRPEVAALGAFCFAAFQNPQEAIMWLGGMHEVLLGLTILSALCLWATGRHFLATLAYCLALLSKESAVVLLLLVPLVEYRIKGSIIPKRQYIYLLLPSAIFAGLYLYLFKENSLVRGEFYGFAPVHALGVLLKSLNRLMFPWLYIALLLQLFRRQIRSVAEISYGIVWMILALLPYVFLTYQDHVPSRHEYLASIGMVWVLALLLCRLDSLRLQHAYLAAFLVVNIGYIWLRKDAQFEERAAPTEQLLKHLRSSPPERLLLDNFPMNPWIAKMTTRLVPGWTPEMILVNEPREFCPGCRHARWNPATETYEFSP